MIDFNYGVALDDSISRLSALKDGATMLESYDYLGLGTVVKRGHAQSGVDLTYIKASGEGNGDAGDQYTGLDRFGRVVDQRWRTSSVEKDRYQYGYDRNGNRLYRDNLVNTALGELYAYDNLNQLTSFDRGTLNGSKNGLSGAASRSQDWDYDALGNFDSVTTDGGSAVTRTHNKQNEITAVSGATSPVFDANGNMTTDETGKQYVYDAWNRLVTVKNSGGTTIASYEYDGQSRRIQETVSGVTTDLYYSIEWQVIEERVSGVATKSYVWSPVYVDAMVARDRDTDANGSLDERLYVMHDVNFNVTGLVNTNGTVVERYTYDPYGLPTVRDGSWTAGSTAYVWQYLHQGGRLSGQSGLYSFRYREYSPTLGRWVTMDPIKYRAHDKNLYMAYSNNTFSHLDPVGEDVVYLFQPSGAIREGHAGILVGDDRYGWVYYSQYPESAAEIAANPCSCVKAKPVFYHYKTFAEALQDPKLKGYEKYAYYTTSLESNVPALNEIKRLIIEKPDYCLVGSNCTDLPAQIAGFAGVTIKGVKVKTESKVQNCALYLCMGAVDAQSPLNTCSPRLTFAGIENGTSGTKPDAIKDWRMPPAPKSMSWPVRIYWELIR